MLRTFAITLALIPLTACATIMHGTTQDVGFSSAPSSARISVNSKEMGQTPTILKLARKGNHIVRMELDGYQPFEATLTKSASGWVFGNIVFGGLIGLVVDAGTGGLYNLTPTQIQGQMIRQGAGAGQAKEGIYLSVVMTPDPTWQKIGQLTRE
jgi:hypothetical protein